VAPKASLTAASTVLLLRIGGAKQRGWSLAHVTAFEDEADILGSLQALPFMTDAVEKVLLHHRAQILGAIGAPIRKIIVSSP
jgi:hypothetical protein